MSATPEWWTFGQDHPVPDAPAAAGPVPGALQPAQPTPAQPVDEPFTLSNVTTALGRVTPTLIIIGVATGAAFAIGSGLVSRFLFRSR